MKEAFSGLGLRTAGAGSACGQLSRYIYSADAYENVASQRHALELLLAHFDFVKGLIGGRIKAVRLVTGSFRIESLWKGVRSGRTASGRFIASESICDPVLDHRAAGLKIIDVFLEPAHVAGCYGRAASGLLRKSFTQPLTCGNSWPICFHVPTPAKPLCPISLFC